MEYPFKETAFDDFAVDNSELNFSESADFLLNTSANPAEDEMLFQDAPSMGNQIHSTFNTM